MTYQQLLKRLRYSQYFLIELFFLPKLIRETKKTQTPITFQKWFFQRVLGFNRKAYWPTHFTSDIGGIENIDVGIDTSPGYSPGCYIQGAGKISIGDYTQIGPNVGIISANHQINDTRNHIFGTVTIGKYCWIGMNSVILPNVELGDFTIVGAGSIVTKSFHEGYCVLAGNPAKIIKHLNQDECIPFENKYPYNGYIPASYFKTYKSHFLWKTKS